MDKQQLSNRIDALENNIKSVQGDIQKMQNDINQKNAQQFALMGAREELINLLNAMNEEKAPN